MRENFERCLRLSRVSEGGYVNHPSDDGGPTMKGITLATYRGHEKNSRLTIDDLKAITDAKVAEIYRRGYWDKVNGDALPSGLDYAVFDYALNSGPSRPAKAIQRIVGVAADGAIGPDTMTAILRRSASDLIKELCAERLAFMKRAKNSKGELLWTVFGRGWARRVAEVEAESLRMAGAPTLQVPTQLPRPSPQPEPEDALAEPDTRSGWEKFIDWLLNLFRK